MSKSKYCMAKKLYAVQDDLQGEEIQEFTLDSLLPLIMKACSKQKLMFWFNFIDNHCILNLRDIEHENYELNIRLQYESGPNIENIKIEVLKNAFLLTPQSNDNNASSAKKESLEIISGDKPVPPHINAAIEKIKAKGIPVTADAINNHLPLGQMSTSARMECNKYLKQMKEASH